MPDSDSSLDKNGRPRKPYYVTFDYAIKYILRDKASFGILEGLLTSILGRQVTIREILESESNVEHPDDKFNRVDLLCSLQPVPREMEKRSGRPRSVQDPYEEQPELVYIEVQINSYTNFFHRVLYGVSKLIVQNLGEGDNYEKLRKVFSINIVNFTLGEGEDYAYHGRTEFKGLHKQDTLKLNLNQRKMFGQRDAGHIFPEYYIFRLKKLPNETPHDHLEQWLYFMKTGNLPEGYDAPGLEAAKQRLDYYHLEPKERLAFDRYQEATRDRRSVEWSREVDLGMALEERDLALEELKAERKQREQMEQEMAKMAEAMRAMQKRLPKP